MSASQIIEEARFRAYLETLSPKKRLKFLRSVTDKLGDPGVVPLTTLANAREIEEAQALWARTLPRLMGA